jgi:PHD/YefM family antitoxin component YafN of YafNO toxin-antitoxin module
MQEISITDIQANLITMIQSAVTNHEPLMLTEDGHHVAVVLASTDYESAEADRKFMRAIIQGFADIETGREVSLVEAKIRLGLK